MVIDAVASAAITYAMGDYHVVLDGIIGPWFLDRLLVRARSGQVEVDYVVLRPAQAVAAQRARGRPGHELAERHEALASHRPASPGPVAHMYREFAALGPYEAHVIDSSAMSPGKPPRLCGGVWRRADCAPAAVSSLLRCAARLAAPVGGSCADQDSSAGLRHSVRHPAR